MTITILLELNTLSLLWHRKDKAMLYKYIENGIIVYIGESNRIPSNGVEITPEEKANLEAVIASKPADTLESVYRLSAETEQYEPFARTHEETVEWYVENINSGEMTLEEVPDDYRAEVEAQIQPEPSEFQQGYDAAVLDMIESGVL